MDRSLARGYTNRFLDRLQPHGEVLAWHQGPRKAKALVSCTESSLSKKPGRVTERLHPLLKPVGGTPRVVSWNRKAESIVAAVAVSSARASAVLHPENVDQTLFDERAAFFNHVVFRSDGEDAQAYGATSSAIGGHAIARLLERGLVAPDDLPRAVRSILNGASCLQVGLDRAGLGAEKPWGLLFPIPGGAAAAVTQRVRPLPGDDPRHVVVVASVRTVLREDMLTDDQRARMDGFDVLAEATDSATQDFEAWIRKNARPWVQPAPEPAPEPAPDLAASPVSEPVPEPQPEEPSPC